MRTPQWRYVDETTTTTTTDEQGGGRQKSVCSHLPPGGAFAFVFGSLFLFCFVCERTRALVEAISSLGTEVWRAPPPPSETPRFFVCHVCVCVYVLVNMVSCVPVFCCCSSFGRFP